MDYSTSDINREITIDDNFNEGTVAEVDASEVKNDAAVKDAKPNEGLEVSKIVFCMCVFYCHHLEDYQFIYKLKFAFCFRFQLIP